MESNKTEQIVDKIYSGCMYGVKMFVHYIIIVIALLASQIAYIFLGKIAALSVLVLVSASIIYYGGFRESKVKDELRE